MVQVTERLSWALTNSEFLELKSWVRTCWSLHQALYSSQAEARAFAVLNLLGRAIGPPPFLKKLPCRIESYTVKRTTISQGCRAVYDPP